VTGNSGKNPIPGRIPPEQIARLCGEKGPSGPQGVWRILNCKGGEAMTPEYAIDLRPGVVGNHPEAMPRDECLPINRGNR